MGTKTHRARAGRAHSEDTEVMEQVGVQVDESAEVREPAARVALDDPGFVEFAVTGTAGSGEFRCADCGYGAVVHRELPQCPMCAGTIWELRGPVAGRPAD